MLAEIIVRFEAQLAEKDAQLTRKDRVLALAEIEIKVLEERLRLWTVSPVMASAAKR